MKQRFKKVQKQILDAEIAAGRNKGSVQLLAVSKTKSALEIAAAYKIGQRHFGESYLQEALKKQQALASMDITWHFIGPIQSNKTRQIAAHFSWVHSVDRFKIAKRLSEQRPDHLPPLNLCIQVNVSAEESKSGVKINELANIIQQIEPLPKIKLRGVMAIPEPESGYEAQRMPYRQLHQIVSQLSTQHLNTFSFGMSGDLKAAIAEGSTIVRIGTALFGARQ